MIEQCPRDERTIDCCHESQGTYARPFPFSRKPESASSVAKDNGADKAIQHCWNRRRPERKVKLRQKEKSQADDEIKDPCKQCQFALYRAKGEIVHRFSFLTIPGIDYTTGERKRDE